MPGINRLLLGNGRRIPSVVTVAIASIVAKLLDAREAVTPHLHEAALDPVMVASAVKTTLSCSVKFPMPAENEVETFPRLHGLDNNFKHHSDLHCFLRFLDFFETTRRTFHPPSSMMRPSIQDLARRRSSSGPRHDTSAKIQKNPRRSFGS